ncbi:hypothetical protein NQ317_002116 [Molorchus minor]|uniref:RING-type domain-containing protein n=1 Tax=Molorchus minor TaxID=1323400 RepID=A0ABQ9JVI2_9CUCU|nr:hypothetical protein NQ317_002116 [Molorchus minor]
MEPPGMEPGLEYPKNPLLCPICHDYFTEPCILSCYHTFCARCLRGREQDRRLICPFCRKTWQVITESDNKPKKMSGYRPMYTADEDTIILKYIVASKAYYKVKGRGFWIDLSNSGLIDRTWQSLKERFDKTIIAKINNPRYNISIVERKNIQLAYRQMKNFGPHRKQTVLDSDSDSNDDRMEVTTHSVEGRPVAASSRHPHEAADRDRQQLRTPCSNCDKRDRTNMYHCNTCGIFLKKILSLLTFSVRPCAPCVETTPTGPRCSPPTKWSTCPSATGNPKRCSQHGEQYIMYSPLKNVMLCVNCFRELPIDIRGQCLDIDTAHMQAAKRLERGQDVIMDLQTSVRDGIIALKGLMDELRRNMDSEKHTINAFCQGMQEAMAKTHATMIMEVQRQFESKDRIYRGQLLVLGEVLLRSEHVKPRKKTPELVRQIFVDVCKTASDSVRLQVVAVVADKDELSWSEFAQCLEPWIGPAAVSQHQSELAAASRMYDAVPPATKKQQTALKDKLLQGEGSFSSHCRSFESQIRELNQQFNAVKEKVGDLHKDIMALRKAQTPPLTARYELLTRECMHLDQSLERQQQELDRMAGLFDASWEEQLWRLRVEQEVFGCQRADVSTLRNELKHLSQVAAQLEPYIRSLTPAQQSQSSSDLGHGQSEQAHHLATLLEHIGKRCG